MLLNAQYIKNKDTLVMDKVIESKTDMYNHANAAKGYQ